MDERNMYTAKHFGIEENCKRLEEDILWIPGAEWVDFDLSGFWDNLDQVIVVAGYDYHKISSTTSFAVDVLKAAARHDLMKDVDGIEDYGNSLYFVFRCGPEWRKRENDYSRVC